MDLVFVSIWVKSMKKCSWMHAPENTHSLHNGKYHCTTDLLIDLFGFDQTCKSLSNSTKAKQLNPNQSNRRSSVHWYVPLHSKWVFSVCSIYFISLRRLPKLTWCRCEQVGSEPFDPEGEEWWPCTPWSARTPRARRDSGIPRWCSKPPGRSSNPGQTCTESSGIVWWQFICQFLFLSFHT